MAFTSRWVTCSSLRICDDGDFSCKLVCHGSLLFEINNSSEVRFELSTLLGMKDRAEHVAAPVLVSTSARTYGCQRLSQ